ncbi:VOC family protein [Puniceibacterium confluentis]|uniref:VOC family protein n=1 Tax=Puniceibacterium confluentis TaxID=1958944 RepID=UPI0011B45438|nr:VOC family protein [Puniceibacterium confluentis]
MDQRISLITLGVRDIHRAAGFYDALGWRRAEAPDGIVAYDLIGQTLGLYPLADLARDMGVPVERLGTGAATYSYNVREREDVAQVLDHALAAGAEILKAAHDVFWGGHIGYFADPEGHIWEVAWNPAAPLSDDGRFRWNGY